MFHTKWILLGKFEPQQFRRMTKNEEKKTTIHCFLILTSLASISLQRFSWYPASEKGLKIWTRNSLRSEPFQAEVYCFEKSLIYGITHLYQNLQ